MHSSSPVEASVVRSCHHKVLVTGASGFIGPHLVQALQCAGYDVRCLVRPSSNRTRLRALGVEIVEGNVRAPESLSRAVSGVDFVFHLASINKALDERDREQVNVVGTGNVAEACARCPTPPVLLVVSSLAAAGPAPVDRCRREGDPVRPISRYGKSKRGGELAAAQWAAEVPTSIVRPPIVFGEGDFDFLTMMQPIARYGFHLVPGIGNRRYSLVHAADASQSFVLAAQLGARLPPSESPTLDPEQGVYFVAVDEMPSYAELGTLIADALGRDRVRVIHGPLMLAWLAGAYGEIEARVRRRAGIVNLDKAREAAAGDWTCDNTRIRALGFKPTEDLPTRLHQTAQWYREQQWLPL